MALTAVTPASGNQYVDAFINNGRHYVNDPGVEGPFNIKYFFGKLTGPGNPTTGVGIPYDWRPFEMAQFTKAIQGWANVANVTFEQVFTQAEALFVERLQNQATAGGTVSASHSLPSTNPNAQSLGTYNFEAVNVRQWSPDQLEPGGNFYRTFIHEIGHGLGLKHPHDNGSLTYSGIYYPGINASDSSAVRQRSLGEGEFNHMFGSVMSYIHGYDFNADGWIEMVPTRQRPVAGDYFLDHGFAATPMAYDVAAVQYLYGANMNFRTGDNVYILPDSNNPRPFVLGPPNEVGVSESIIYQADQAYWECIWDAGGIDEMRYDGARDTIIDLRAATLDAAETSRGVLSYAAFIGGGYTIANGVVIENATGGNGRDKITGNEADNVLNGRAGADTISGLDGADTINGGAGNDLMLGGAGDDRINGGGGNDTIHGGAGDDRVSGGAGADVFIYQAGDGTDRILDFAVGEDKVDLTSWAGIAGFEDLTVLTAATGHAYLNFGGGDKLIFVNVAAASLSASDFLFA
jgi:serralysin